MHRIDTSTKAVDLFGTGKHGFKDGNKLLGIAATVFNALWANSVQEELVNLTEAVGLTLDPANNAQIASAIKTAANDAPGIDNSAKLATTDWVRNAMANIATAAGFLIILAPNGCIAFPSWLGGLIIQWGDVLTDSTGHAHAGFPIRFPNSLFKIVATYTTLTDSTYGGVTVQASTQTTGNFWLGNTSGVPANMATIVYYAIGY